MTGNSMPYRTLGATGERVSAIGLGGWHLGLKHVDEPLSQRIIQGAIDGGINFMDNSWDYNDGASEVRMGKALKGRRDKVFLMTKIDGRSKKEAARQLDESLRRLRVDMIDLVQHHEIIRFEDPHRIFDPEDGAQAALLEAKQAGKLRYIGFTGHKDPHIHLYMLEVAANFGQRMDTAQLPLSVMDAHYRSFEKLVLPELVRKNMGVLGMKCLANGHILKSNTVTAVECLQYALNLPTSVVVTGIDTMEILNQALQTAATFQPMNPAQVHSLLAKTAGAASRGDFELFKTSSMYDATASNPDWLGDEPQRVQQAVQG